MKFLIVLSFMLSFLLLAGCAAPAAPAETAVPTEAALGPVLSNPNATEEAKALYEYLCSLSGTAVLNGQMESTWMGSPDYEMDYIFEKTGKYPAIRGLDYMHDDFNGVNERAKKWWGESDTNPTARELQTTPWIWFMTWHTDHITKNNNPEALKALYSSNYVITKDELPPR